MLAITNINGPNSTTRAYPGQNENKLASNYYSNNSGLTFPSTTLDVYHDIIVVYTGASSFSYKGLNLGANTSAYWLDGSYIGSHAQTQLNHTPIAIIVANNANNTHTGSYFKNLTATGVFVIGFPQLMLNNTEVELLLPINDGLQGSPELDNVTSQYLNNGIELAYSSGWHDYTTESTGITSSSGDGTLTQTGGTFALSGDAVTYNYNPPQQFSG